MSRTVRDFRNQMQERNEARAKVAMMGKLVAAGAVAFASVIALAVTLAPERKPRPLDYAESGPSVGEDLQRFGRMLGYGVKGGDSAEDSVYAFCRASFAMASSAPTRGAWSGVQGALDQGQPARPRISDEEACKGVARGATWQRR